MNVRKTSPARNDFSGDISLGIVVLAACVCSTERKHLSEKLKKLKTFINTEILEQTQCTFLLEQ